MVDRPDPRTLGVVLYPGFDLLDVTGPRCGAAAGLDMALHVITRLTAPDVGENVARVLEYEWHADSKRDPFCQA